MHVPSERDHPHPPSSGLNIWPQILDPLTTARFSVTLDAAWIRWWDAVERKCGPEGSNERKKMAWEGKKSINPFTGSWWWSRNHILSRDKDPHCWYEVKPERHGSRRPSKDYDHPSWKSSELNRPEVVTVRPLKAEGGEAAGMLRYDAAVLPSYFCCDWYLAFTLSAGSPCQAPLDGGQAKSWVVRLFFSKAGTLQGGHPHAPFAVGREARVPRRAGEEATSLHI